MFYPKINSALTALSIAFLTGCEMEKQAGRRLRVMLRDLRLWKSELSVLRDGANQVSRAEADLLSGKLDTFGARKLALVKRLMAVTENVGRLRELRLHGRSLDTIRMSAQNVAELKEIQTEWQALTKLFTEPDQQTSLRLLQTEIALQIEQNSESADPTQPSATTLDLLKKKSQRKNRRKRDESKTKDGAIEMHVIKPANGKEQIFLEEVRKQTEEENAMLDDLYKGVTELGEIAKTMSVAIDVSRQLTGQLDVKVEQTSAKMQDSTKRADQIIQDENSGCARWLPILVCSIVLFSLILYLARAITS